MASFLFLTMLQALTNTLGMDPDTLPLISTEVKEAHPSILDLWEFEQRKRGMRMASKGPKTILSSDEGAMTNLVPQDGSHPLYDSSPENIDLRRMFLLDHMFDQLVDPNDLKWKKKEVVNLAGSTVTFERDSDGNLFVAGIRVRSARILSDGTALYQLEDVPFGYRYKVMKAWTKLKATEEEDENPLMEKNPSEFEYQIIQEL